MEPCHLSDEIPTGLFHFIYSSMYVESVYLICGSIQKLEKKPEIYGSQPVEISFAHRFQGVCINADFILDTARSVRAIQTIEPEVHER